MVRAAMSNPIIQFESVMKRFPGVTALAEVSFSVRAGETHALVGENGAGKSTLGKIVAGIYRPDGGRMLFDGRATTFRSPLEARDAGVAIVHQELAFCPNLSVAENLFLGCMPSRRGLLRRGEMARRAREMLAEVGLDVDPWTPMERLSTGQEQLVQIAVAVGRGARVIIFDEPTSSLSAAEAERLFEIMGRLRRQGVTMLYVSHRLEEIMRLCDRASVLRDGRFIQTVDVPQSSPEELVRLMIGRPLEQYYPQHLAMQAGAELLAVENLSAGGRFSGVSFQVRAGEIVGLAGLVGAGRSEVARAIFGIDPIDRGTIRVGGRPARIRSPQDAIACGIGLLPEDRKRQGLVLSMTCKENVSLASLAALKRRGRLDHRRERGLARSYCEQLRVRTPGIDAGIAGLSGGNQQKLALAKWLARNCRVLILDEPTRGVDVGAKSEIHALVDRLAAEGKGVVLISSELPEVLNLSTRVLVLARGRLVGEMSRADATQEKLMRLMAGVAESRLN